MAIRLEGPVVPEIGHRLGAGAPVAVLSGSGMRVRTLWVARTAWGWTPQEIAREYGLRLDQVEAALAFAEVHRADFEAELRVEEELARTAVIRRNGI